MTTNIDILLDESTKSIEFSKDNLNDIILDMSNSKQDRIKALELYYVDNNENTVELINRMIGMYQLSGISNLKEFLQLMCAYNTKLPTFLKLEVVKGLLEYNELDEDIEDNDTEEVITQKKQINSSIHQKNLQRKVENTCLLDLICSNLTQVPTPCRIEAILLLMDDAEYNAQSLKYFIELINDNNIECEFRYNTILTLENKSSKLMKDNLLTLFNNKSFVDRVLITCKHITEKEFPNFKPDNTNDVYFKLLINRLNYDTTKQLFKEHTSDIIDQYEEFLFKAQLNFCLQHSNMAYYRILSAQYLLQKFNLAPIQRNSIQDQLLDFAQDEFLDYDRRADAADVLLRMGTDMYKYHARHVIMQLGNTNTKGKTIFDNAQNVHVEEVEQSVVEVLEFFADLPTMKVNDIPITFGFVKEQVLKIINLQKEKIKPEEEENFKEYEEKINVALKRIEMDRALYSKYNNTLANILLKVWTYLSNHEYKEEMINRLLEELEEMSGTCSTGFASRMINVVSGFGEFNIRISWEDQISSNFFGRLNAKARLLQDKDNVFRTEKYKDVVELWLYDPKRKDLRDELLEDIDIKTVGSELKNVLIDKYLKDDTQAKIEECYESFSFGILDEMTIASCHSYQRKNFSLFFRTYVASIREEMYQEFKEYLDDTSFDLYMRKALINYEGI